MPRKKNDEEVIERAANLIGASDENDYKLAPLAHAGELERDAQDLAAVLSSFEVGETARQYVAEDKAAGEAQKEFRRVFGRANLLVLITAILTALVLAVGILSAFLRDDLEKWIIGGLSLLTIISGALASKDIYAIKTGQMLEEWMTKRASAETLRLEYFYTIVESKRKTSAGAIPLNLLKLEYFRRYQLDMQIAYYRDKSRGHREEAKRTLSLSGWAIAGAAIATGAAGTLAVLNLQFAAVAALGTVFTALSSHAAIREEVYQNRRNSERFGRTLKTLEGIRKKLGDVREAVLDGKKNTLRAFIEAVHEQLSLEHRQWLNAEDNARGALAKLEENLNQMQPREDK